MKKYKTYRSIFFKANICLMNSLIRLIFKEKNIFKIVQRTDHVLIIAKTTDIFIFIELVMLKKNQELAESNKIDF